MYILREVEGVEVVYGNIEDGRAIPLSTSNHKSRIDSNNQQ